jgi:voltage-gated potassium channel
MNIMHSFALKVVPLLRWLGIVLFIILFGTFGFIVIESYSFLDALYMTVTTIATIGYFEVHTLSQAGRIFNIIFIITSFSTFTYALAKLTQFIASGEMGKYYKNKKNASAMDKLKDHVIICGFGRNGQQAAKTLMGHKVNFVVVDHREEHIDNFLETYPQLLYVKGDATNDEVLKRAGIDRAGSLICALPTDADNVFIVLSARSLNKKLHIITRASAASSVPKMRKAGADNVIMPDKIGGTHMATLVSRPDVVEFIDYISGEQGDSINIESVAYNKLPPEIRDKQLREIMAWKKTGVNCIGVKDSKGKFIINPPEDMVIREGMKVLVLGNRHQISEMKHNVEGD